MPKDDPDGEKWEYIVEIGYHYYPPLSGRKRVSVKKKALVIVRTYSAGCFFGVLIARNGQEVELQHGRRLWYWEGAASLSQLAVDGSSKPDKCKFPTPVPHIILTQAIEIIECTSDGANSIMRTPVWKQ